VQHRTVADMAIFLDQGVLLRETVHDAVVLHIGSCQQHDTTEVTSKAGVWSDVAIGADMNITY
jgi:hypothetical protein